MIFDTPCRVENDPTGTRQILDAAAQAARIARTCGNWWGGGKLHLDSAKTANKTTQEKPNMTSLNLIRLLAVVGVVAAFTGTSAQEQFVRFSGTTCTTTLTFTVPTASAQVPS
jgi:hypothetical protein